MGQKLASHQLELYKRIDEILYYKWDPIGISDDGWARDEYQSYLPQIFNLALEYDIPEPIMKYLKFVSVKHLGLSPNNLNDIAIAKLILRTKEFIEES